VSDFFIETDDLAFKSDADSRASKAIRTGRTGRSAMDARVREIGDRERRSGHSPQVTVRFVEPWSLKPEGKP
jgi:hypothetical protein